MNKPSAGRALAKRELAVGSSGRDRDRQLHRGGLWLHQCPTPQPLRPLRLLPGVVPGGGARVFRGSKSNFSQPLPIVPYATPSALHPRTFPCRNHHPHPPRQAPAQALARTHRHNRRHHRQGSGPLRHDHPCLRVFVNAQPLPPVTHQHRPARPVHAVCECHRRQGSRTEVVAQGFARKSPSKSATSITKLLERLSKNKDRTNASSLK
jgi:hypothetical protein